MGGSSQHARVICHCIQVRQLHTGKCPLKCHSHCLSNLLTHHAKVQPWNPHLTKYRPSQRGPHNQWWGWSNGGHRGRRKSHQ